MDFNQLIINYKNIKIELNIFLTVINIIINIINKYILVILND